MKTIPWLCCLVSLLGCGGHERFEQSHADQATPRKTSTWSHIGGPEGRKFADLSQIDKDNVDQLEVAWVYRTGEENTVFQNTPVLVDGRLLLCTPHNKLIALDPLTGGELWTYDAAIDRSMRPANEFNCRGVTPWQGNAAYCPNRVFMATNDARLLAINTDTGEPCTNFGNAGEIDLAQGVGRLDWSGEYQITSPPVTTGELVVVGSAISDGNRLTAPSGVVRAYDVLTGELRWAFDLAPPDFDYASGQVSSAGYALGTPNVWAPISIDHERDLVFLPTGNPAPDYYRSGTVDMAHFGAAIVALRASTGELVWHFNTVIRDFWDFDVPSQPVLANLNMGGESVPALIQATKMGHIFVLNRETGKPLIDVEYREVPRYGPLKDQLSAVQPFPPEAFQVSRSYEKGSSLLGLCDATDADSVIGPVFTPITETWTVGLPSNMGATNWGGVAVDERRGLIVVNTNNVPFRTKIISRAKAQDLINIVSDDQSTASEKQAARDEFARRFKIPEGAEVALQNGVDYMMSRHVYLDPTIGIPCAGLPLSEIMVLDVNQQRVVWRRAHGTTRDITGIPFAWGSPGMGGSLITQTGLVFIGAASERAFRAYDIDSGEELWQHVLPAPANANPMSYEVNSAGSRQQFVVIAAGGDARAGIGGQGDHLVAFSLGSH